MLPIPRTTLLQLPLAILISCLVGCTEAQSVPASDVMVSKGPDGETIYSPRSDSTAVSCLAQYLQLKADFKGISKDGYFLDTQLANLHGQSTLLARAAHFNWKWHDMNGQPIDATTSLAEVNERIKAINVNG